MNQVNLSQAIHSLNSYLGSEYRHDGEYHADCPFCGKPRKNYQTHFSYKNDGFYCHVCGKGGSIQYLVEYLHLDGSLPSHNAPQAIKKPIRSYPTWYKTKWLKTPFNADYDHPMKYQYWRDYKPLTNETIDKYYLGVGSLPNQNSKRLIVPIIRYGKLYGLRGRSIGYNLIKWINAKDGNYRYPYLIEQVRPKSILYIVENMVDALLIMQESNYTVDAIAPCIGAKWRDMWTRYIAYKQPKIVIAMGDNDMAGNRFSQQVKMSMTKYDITCKVFKWSNHHKEKADIMDIL